MLASRADAAWPDLMPHGREDNLPAELREHGNVKKGTVLLFSRDSQGRLKGKANGHPLVEVQSPKLCQVWLLVPCLASRPCLHYIVHGSFVSLVFVGGGRDFLSGLHLWRWQRGGCSAAPPPPPGCECRA